MPSYPTSVKSFTTKNAGDSILAAHVNDIQDEVNAVEAGLLNGTAPLNSSNSTVAALSVTGNTTLAASLQVSGNSTFQSISVLGGSTLSGSVQVGGNSTFQSISVLGGSTLSIRSVTPPPHMALVFLDSTITIGSSATSTVFFVAEAVLTNSSMHSTATNAERLIPQSTGVYQASVQLAFAANSTGGRNLAILDSSGVAIARVIRSSGADAPNIVVTGYKRFDALGGYLTVAFAESGVSTMSLSSGVGESWFSMVKL